MDTVALLKSGAISMRNVDELLVIVTTYIQFSVLKTVRNVTMVLLEGYSVI